MRKMGLMILIVSVITMSGCSGFQIVRKSPPKKIYTSCPQGSVCYTNAMIVDIKVEKLPTDFAGPGNNGVKKTRCGLLLKSIKNEEFLIVRDGALECSDERKNTWVAVFYEYDRILSVTWKPDPYIEEKYAPLPDPTQ